MTVRALNLKLSNDQASEQLALQATFRTGAPIRGIPQEIKPSLWAKLKLVFDPNFKVTAGGVPVSASKWLKARAIFEQKFTIKKQGRLIGRGFFTKDLEKMGWSERELDALVNRGLLRLVTTKWQGSWRNTYVCLMDVNEEEIQNAKKR